MSIRRNVWRLICLVIFQLAIIAIATAACSPATNEPAAQSVSANERSISTQRGANDVFDSGSNGSDGALILNQPGIVNFFALPNLDPEGDGIYHFTTISVTAGVTVDMSAALRPAVVWLASESATIDGALLLNGQDGIDFASALPGAGGFAGGKRRAQGLGPGGGMPATTYGFGGGGAGHRGNGKSDGGSNDGAGGPAYGNKFVLPLIGGSGGGGGFASTDGGGGAGGGAILIASSDHVRVNGSIAANAGDGTGRSGGGSGGAIRLVAPTIAGSGILEALGGSKGPLGAGGDGSGGRIRIEAFYHNFAGTIAQNYERSTPTTLFLQTAQLPIRVTQVGGVAVPDHPAGGFNPADLMIDQAGVTTITVEAQGVPVGTVATLNLMSETGDVLTISTTPLAGSELLSTAVATATIPHGFTQVSVQATWQP